MRKINLQEEQLPLGPLLACLNTLKDRASMGEPAPVGLATGGQRVQAAPCKGGWAQTPTGKKLLERTAVAEGQAGLSGYEHKKRCLGLRAGAAFHKDLEGQPPHI